MPRALLVTLFISLGLHLAVLFGPEIEVPDAPAPLPISAELRLPPLPVPPVVDSRGRTEPSARQGVPSRKGERKKSAPRAVRTLPPSSTARAEFSLPDVEARVDDVADVAGSEAVIAEQDYPPAGDAARAKPNAVPADVRLPARGVIRFRVDRGDSGFEIGRAYQKWEFADGRYRLRSVVETTGLIRLLRTVFIEMESQGLYSGTGLQPEVFAIRRDTRKARERALFDWEAMRVRVGNRGDQVLDPGAQDLLSLYYQLGFLDLPANGHASLPVATGKKYSTYRLEVVGDEDIEVPLGVLRTLHLRAPGENVTEFWLAYDYGKLPVKIRHLDSDGGSLVQVATEIQTGP